MVLVDQHAAHERILYEEARAHLVGEGGASQVLLFPRVLDLTPAELETLLSAEPMIRRLGYEVALFDRLFATSLPHGDPHGRATYVRVSMEELDRRFGRR